MASPSTWCSGNERAKPCATPWHGQGATALSSACTSTSTVQQDSTTPGAFVVLLGPDGCGKTTVLAGIGHCWEPLLGRYQPFHLHPRLGESKSAKPRPGFDPHAMPPRGALASLAKLALLLGQYRVGDMVAVRPIVRAGGLAVFDRYFHDLLVDPTRFRYGGPAGLPRTMLPLLPVPDLVMLLDGPAEVLHARKPELAPAVIDELRQRYRAAVGGQAIVVDVDRTPAEVCHTVHRLLLATLHRRARAAILADAARQAR